MKFCAHCGAEMYDEAVVCVKCGCPVQPIYHTQAKAPQQVDDTVSTGLVVLSILIPLFGIIYWPVKAKERPKCARACGCIGLASWIISFTIMLAMMQMGAL